MSRNNIGSLQLEVSILPQSFCEHQEAIHIAHKPVKNGRTTHNESHSHFVWEEKCQDCNAF